MVVVRISRSAEAGSLRASSVMMSSRPANNGCNLSLWACVKAEVSPLSISALMDVKNWLAAWRAHNRLVVRQ
jgi:citrate lyase gamma subunit